MAYGQSGHLAIHFQNSYGTANVSSAHHIPILSESVMETIGQLVEKNMYGRFAESPVHEGLHQVQGEIRGEAHPVGLGAFLKAVCGQPVTTPVNSAFQHVFVPAQTDWDGHAALPPMTVNIHRDVGSAFLYSDLVAGGLTLEVAHGQLLSSLLSVVGGRFSQTAAIPPVYPAGKPWAWEVVSASYAGQPLADVRQLSFRLENNLAPFHTLNGGRYPSRVKRTGPQRVTVEGSLLFNDQALFQEFLGQTEKPLVVALAGETVAVSYTNLLSLELPKLRLSEFKPVMNGPGQLEVGFSASAVFDETLGYGLKATLVNTWPAY